MTYPAIRPGWRRNGSRRVCVVHEDLDGWLMSSVPPRWMYLARPRVRTGARQALAVAGSYVFASAHPGQGDPAPDRGEVGREEPLDEHRGDRLLLRDTSAGKPGDQARLDDTGAAGYRYRAADDGGQRVDGNQGGDTRLLPTACAMRRGARMTRSWARVGKRRDVKSCEGSVAIALMLTQMVAGAADPAASQPPEPRTSAIRPRRSPSEDDRDDDPDNPWLPPEFDGTWGPRRRSRWPRGRAGSRQSSSRSTRWLPS